MPKCYLLLGADIGDKKVVFARAKQLIGESLGKITRQSSLYESQAWGFESDTTFLNQAIEVETALSPIEVLEGIHQIEAALGRVRSGSGYQSRPIDIDILFYGAMIVDTATLTIPHRLLHKRMFALEPLTDLVPDFVHPVMGKSIAELKDECTDSGPVCKA